MIESFAHFYVNVLEPGLMILAICLAIVFVIYLFNLLRGGEKNDLVSNIVNIVVKTIIKFIQLIGRMFVFALKMLYKTYSLILATVRDFFKSEI